MMGGERSHLIVDVRPGDRVSIASGHEISIELVKKSGQLARLRVSAPKDVKIEKHSGPCVGEVVASMA